MKPKKPSKYEKPVFIKEEKLTFPREVIGKFITGSDSFCTPCGRCHGCR